MHENTQHFVFLKRISYSEVIFQRLVAFEISYKLLFNVVLFVIAPVLLKF